MTYSDFEQFAHEASAMSDEEKRLLWDMLNEQLRDGKNGSTEKSVSTFGWAKGRMTISDDFDAPLHDFKVDEK